jgi:hypothetical protein
MATEALNFASQEPVHETDRVRSSVIARNNNIDVLGQRIGVAEPDYWDVYVTSLSNGLVVHGRIGDDDQPWFSETSLRVIGKSTGGES